MDDKGPFKLDVEDHPERDWTQQELWDGTMGLLRDRGVDIPRMVIEQAMRTALRFGLRKEEEAAVRQVIPGPMSADQSRWKYQMDVRDFDWAHCDTVEQIHILASKDPGHGFHQVVFAAVRGDDDVHDPKTRVGHGRDIMAAIQDLLGQESAEAAEGDLPGASRGLEMPREELLEAALSDAYQRIEQLLAERGPVLDQANALILSMEKREAIGEDWHAYFDQWLRTFAEWCVRMGGDYWGHRDASHLIRSLFAELSGFKPQETPDAEPVFYPTMVRGEAPQRDQEWPETKDIPEETADNGQTYWERRRESVEAGPPEWRARRPQLRQDKSVTHEVVTRFNMTTGYVEWRGYRILTGALEPLDAEMLAANADLLDGVMLLYEVWTEIIEKSTLGEGEGEKPLADLLVGDITERVRGYLGRIPRVTEDDLADSHGGPELGSPAPGKRPWKGGDDV